MVGLEPDRESPGKPDRGTEGRHVRTLRRDEDEVLVPHDLADRGDHLGRESPGNVRQVGRRRLVRQQPVAELADGHRADRRERVVALLVVDQPRDIVDLPRDHRLVEEGRQLDVGEAVLGGDALLLRRCRDPGEFVTRAPRRRPSQHRAQVREAVRPAGEGDAARPRHAGRPPWPEPSSLSVGVGGGVVVGVGGRVR